MLESLIYGAPLEKRPCEVIHTFLSWTEALMESGQRSIVGSPYGKPQFNLTRIGNGGAGQSGLIEGKTNEVDIDIGITYHKTAEQIAIKNGVVSGCKYKDSNSMRPCFGDSCKDYEERPCYTLRDHFYLAGRKNNTADIQDEHDITETFSKLFNAGENGTARFSSRFDKSALSLSLSLSLSLPFFYLWFMVALTATIKLGEYTVTDRGPYLRLSNTDKDLADQLEIYKRGDEYEELLNPADIITSKDSDNKELVQDFVQWVLSGDGQDVIANFHEEDGYCLYRGFPTEDGEDGEDVEASDCKWELS
ncbi:hypothetical protein G4B84_004829 [Aspergillus flavus NRRL3357]|nr:uncharacterized protein G4B84_004829 [Aspergillus flavus NRRL3357]QMW29494.1 hypothetical protein G4B84_004829 [Aspergillus flavus NRRL3357]